jgi:hypothetical protein
MQTIPVVQQIGVTDTGKQLFQEVGRVQADPNALKFDVVKDHGTYFVGNQSEDGLLVWGWGTNLTQAVQDACERYNA